MHGRGPAVLVLLLLVARGLGAQAPGTPSRIAPALRADIFAGRERAAHLGVGAGVRLGTYARFDLGAAAGASDGWPGADGPRASGRVEAMGRFVLDPFEQFGRGAYAAAGLALRLDEGARRRVHLTAVVGVEGRREARWLPAVEAGFGGGVRLGLVLRRSSRTR